jgi:hypothetical protein
MKPFSLGLLVYNTSGTQVFIIIPHSFANTRKEKPKCLLCLGCMVCSNIVAHSTGGRNEEPRLVLNFEALASLRGEIINTSQILVFRLS